MKKMLNLVFSKVQFARFVCKYENTPHLYIIQNICYFINHFYNWQNVFNSNLCDGYIRNLSFRHKFYKSCRFVFNMPTVFATGNFTTSYQTLTIVLVNHSLLYRVDESLYPRMEVALVLPVYSFVGIISQRYVFV